MLDRRTQLEELLRKLKELGGSYSSMRPENRRELEVMMRTVQRLLDANTRDRRLTVEPPGPCRKESQGLMQGQQTQLEELLRILQRLKTSDNMSPENRRELQAVLDLIQRRLAAKANRQAAD